MARDQRTHIEGFREAREALQTLSRGVQRGVGKRALRAPRTIVADAWRRFAPISTRFGNPTPGSLRASVQEVDSRAERGRPTVAVIAGDVAAVPTEYGTSKMAAIPWARRAAAAVADAALRAFGDALRPEIDAAAARAAKRGAKK